MAAVTWTKEQQQAIQARDCSLLVAAAAGSGKTAVLVERIIQRILDLENGVDIDRLMVVTFTDAAASEMRERIGTAISNRIQDLSFQENAAFRKRLKRQLTLLNKATISTLHSFCSKLIRKNFNKIELDPNFRVLDAIEADLLKEEVLEAVLEAQYEGTKEIPGLSETVFETLLDFYGGQQGDGSFKELLLQIYEKTSADPFPKQWRDTWTEVFSPQTLADCGGDFKNTIWGKVLVTQLQREVPHWISQCKRAVRLCEEGENPAYIPAFQYHLDYFECISNAIQEEHNTWDTIRQAVQAYSFDRFANKTKGCDERILQKVKAMAEDMKKAVEEYRKVYFSQNTAENLDELSKSYPTLKGLCALVDAFTEAYAQKKQQKGAVDYDDLEHFALKILTEYPEVAKELQEFYEEIYTDECQDTNMTQETILSLFTKRPPHKSNLFMVGDVKQSIYGFRQARPDIFLKKYDSFSKEEEAAQRLIPLYKNFRSRKDVIGSVNYIFTKLMTKEVCGMNYTKDEYLYYGADYKEPAYDIACELLVADRKEEAAAAAIADTSEELEQSKTELEAIMIGNRIQALLEEGTGALTYKDIVILLRATKGKAELYSEVLSQMGIPVFCDTNTAFYQSTEGKVILALLQIIDNPLQDIPFLAVLKSPIGGFTENEIVIMRLADPKRQLYYNLKTAAEAGNEKAAGFLETLNTFRNYAEEHDLSQLLLELYEKTDYYNYAGIFKDGAQRQANLQKIYEEAVKYETQTGGGIFEFLSYVERIRSGNGDLGGATVLGENDNVVRIMSIHKSKGLEFPVVFVADMDKGFNRMDSNKSVLMHPELGFGMDGFDREYRVKYDTVSKTVIQWKMNQELIAEEIRLLYVAMTRAKEKLILCGMVSDLETTFQRYWEVLSDKEDSLPAQYALKARSYFDLLLPILLRHPDLQAAREAAGIPNSPFAWRQPVGEEACRFVFRQATKTSLNSGYSMGQVGSQAESQTVLQTEPQLKSQLESATTRAASYSAFDGIFHGKTDSEKTLQEKVTEKLSAVYPFAEATEIPAKISVSRLNHGAELPQILQQPHFMDGERTRTAAEWGTITHYILQYIPLEAIHKQNIQALCRKQGLTEEETEAFPLERITRFFESDVGRRMRRAIKVYREKPFTMEVAAGQLFPQLSAQNQDTVLVQGIIDCYFEEADGVVILDYKTDRVIPGREQEAAERYRMQLELYQRAVEAETGKKVKEKIICFLQTGGFVVQ